MYMSDFNWKCSLMTAVVSVLIYLFIVYFVNMNAVGSIKQFETDWWKSIEVLMFVSVVIGYNFMNLGFMVKTFGKVCNH
jgi:succinate dehydrogenase hydrophobic anchor subunit